MANRTGKYRAASRRVAIVAADAGRLAHLRAPLLRTLAAGGHKVLCLTGAAGEIDIRALAALGAEHGAFDLGPSRLRLVGDGGATAMLAERLAAWSPNVVIGIGFKPMLLAAAAARKAKVARVVLVASTLGAIDERATEAANIAMRWMVRRALRAADALVVHNPGHEQRLRELDLIRPALPVHVVPGAGIDLGYYCAVPLPNLSQGLVFLMTGKCERRKGVMEFCEAARRIKSKAPGARFVLATTPMEGKAGVTAAELKPYADVVEITEAGGDPRALLAACHVAVQPSYGEGMAHEVLAALACGRPVVTTTAPGCRETVDERVSGVLVPPCDATALAAAIESFLRRPDLIPWMSQAARTKAERRFDANAATAALLRILELEEAR